MEAALLLEKRQRVYATEITYDKRVLPFEEK